MKVFLEIAPKGKGDRKDNAVQWPKHKTAIHINILNISRSPI